MYLRDQEKKSNLNYEGHMKKPTTFWTDKNVMDAGIEAEKNFMLSGSLYSAVSAVKSKYRLTDKEAEFLYKKISQTNILG
jgi:hypothetical protein